MGQFVYPITAIVGQEELKLALILNLIHPRLGGVLIRGEKGTAKSTAVRGLSELMEEVNVMKGCMFHCQVDTDALCDICRQKKAYKIQGDAVEKYKRKVVELPISATEDRVVGSLDIEHALKNGEKVFEPGILAQANGNILYVDEVNLLEDHIVDVLLDSAAMGVNTVEREGISFSHPARFILVGTMNPEEGDLRPQLLDRFALVVDIMGEEDIQMRKEVVKRRLAFEEDPEFFTKQWEKEQEALRIRIQKAKEKLSQIHIPEEIYDKVAKVCTSLQVDGHRADITMIKTAQAIAAFEQRDCVQMQDLIKAAKLALPHRLRRGPFEEGYMTKAQLEALMNE